MWNGRKCQKHSHTLISVWDHNISHIRPFRYLFLPLKYIARPFDSVIHSVESIYKNVNNSTSFEKSIENLRLLPIHYISPVSKSEKQLLVKNSKSGNITQINGFGKIIFNLYNTKITGPIKLTTQQSISLRQQLNIIF